MTSCEKTNPRTHFYKKVGNQSKIRWPDTFYSVARPICKWNGSKSWLFGQYETQSSCLLFVRCLVCQDRNKRWQLKKNIEELA